MNLAILPSLAHDKTLRRACREQLPVPNGPVTLTLTLSLGRERELVKTRSNPLRPRREGAREKEPGIAHVRKQSLELTDLQMPPIESGRHEAPPSRRLANPFGETGVHQREMDEPQPAKKLNPLGQHPFCSVPGKGLVPVSNSDFGITAGSSPWSNRTSTGSDGRA